MTAAAAGIPRGPGRAAAAATTTDADVVISAELSEGAHPSADAGLTAGARATTTTVVFSGDLDLLATPALAGRLAVILGQPPGLLVFDLARVSFIDCAAARVITDAARLRGGDRRTVIRAPSPAVRRILALTALGADCVVEC